MSDASVPAVADTLDPILVEAVAKALVRERMLHIAQERAGLAINPDYMVGAVDSLWRGTDETAVTQRLHYLTLAKAAIEIVRGFDSKVAAALAMLPQTRTTPILENTAVLHTQVPITPHFAHPVDRFPKDPA